MPSWAINSTKLSNYIKLNKMEKTLNNAETAQLGIGAVSGSTSTDRLIFFYRKMSEKREISAHIFNDVFSEFEETFCKGRKYKSAMVNFKKYMKIASENRGHEIIVSRVNKYETVVHGLKNVWSVQYCH